MPGVLEDFHMKRVLNFSSTARTVTRICTWKTKRRREKKKKKHFTTNTNTRQKEKKKVPTVYTEKTTERFKLETDVSLHVGVKSHSVKDNLLTFQSLHVISESIVGIKTRSQTSHTEEGELWCAASNSPHPSPSTNHDSELRVRKEKKNNKRIPLILRRWKKKIKTHSHTHSN